jgi:hypothetical protein
MGSAYWQMFLGPAVLWPLALYVFGRMRPSYNTPAAAQGRCLVLLVAGAAGALFCVTRLSPLQHAATLFQTDPSCLAGPYLAKSRAGAPCHSEHATIVLAKHGRGRRSYRDELILAFNDGRQQQFGLPLSGTVEWQPVFEEAQRSPGMSARVQIFEGNVVAIATADAVAPTEWDPQWRIWYWQGLALFGAGTFVGGLIELAISWRMLF